MDKQQGPTVQHGGLDSIPCDKSYSLEELMLKQKLQYFGHLMLRANLLEKTLMLGKTDAEKKAGGEGDDRG